jgi:hypothetical protein
MSVPSQEIKTYNGVLENAARVLLGLGAFYPSRLSLEEIRIVDYFAAYGEDVGLETSLQDRPAWRGQVFGFRESMVSGAIDFLLAARQIEGDGQTGYRSIEENCMSLGLSSYLDEIFDVCYHMSKDAEIAGLKAYFTERKADIESRVDVPFEGPPGDPEFHLFEKRQEKDLARMEGLEMTAFFFKQMLEKNQVAEHPCLTRDWMAAVQSAADTEMLNCRRTIVNLRAMRELPQEGGAGYGRQPVQEELLPEGFRPSVPRP